MKLLEFEVIQSEHPEDLGKIKRVVKLSTLNERELYERTRYIGEDCGAATQAHDDWDKRLKAHLDVIDSLVFYYIMEDEEEPEVGATLELETIKLKRKD